VGIGFVDNVATVLIAGAEVAIRDAEKLIVVTAQGREPGDFTQSVGGADGNHGGKGWVRKIIR
jgi:hypothetical protein